MPKNSSISDMPKLVISDKKGGIFIHPNLEAAGMEAGNFFSLKRSDLIRLPAGSQLFMLPRRSPVGYDRRTNRFVSPNKYSAAAVFTPPGYTVTYNSAYVELDGSKILPLYSYAACGFYNGSIYAAAVRIDRDRRHDSRLMDIELVKRGIKKLKKIFAKNRLIKHLGKCALVYGCPNAQNFFLGRHEAPLPASPSCNSACAGCISYQPAKDIPPSQPRIKFIPTPEEISQVALYHLSNAPGGIVSFGQGCEGEPLLAGDVICEAIKLIRNKTSKGTINMNTNASSPGMLARLLDAGLDSIRVSANSARKAYYNRYYSPAGYTFEDVKRSMRIAKSKGGFVSLNYLTMPGFNDLKEEAAALKRFVREHYIDMIQWRNLNFDPLSYFKKLKIAPAPSELLGIRELIESIAKEFPRLRMGYFNPRAAVSPRR